MSSPPATRTLHGIVDLHSHYPMHRETRGSLLSAMTHKRRKTLGGVFRATALDIASRIANYRKWDAKPAVSVESLIEGRVSVALSVLYQPLDEIELDHEIQIAPDASYFRDLMDQLNRIESHIKKKHADRATIAHDPGELDAALGAGKLALVHVVEGGFHVGATPADIDKNVRVLRDHGVAYVTVAHLFWRGIATNAAAIPFLPDGIYELIFREPKIGLSDLGRALVDAMAREKILVDLTHMSELGIEETLARLPPDAPVIASHMACRFKSFAYNLTDETIRAIGKRGGVLGVILCDHFANEGNARTTTFEQSFAVVCKQIDHVCAITGSDDHAAIGTDLDGFIKPTLAGLDDARDLARLEVELVKHYGATKAEKICNANALRVLRSYWRSESIGSPRAIAV